MQKEKLYKGIKIAGMVSFIPLMLAAGPLAGYLAGDYLKNEFGLAPYILFICIGIGFIASITEVVRTIRLVVKITRKP